MDIRILFSLLLQEFTFHPSPNNHVFASTLKSWLQPDFRNVIVNTIETLFTVCTKKCVIK